MLIQHDNWRCGPHAIVNACLALGHDHSLDEVTRLARTTRQRGTDERGVLTALAAMEYTALPMTARGPELWSHVRAAIDSGHAVILCVDSEDHWVAVIGKIGQRIVVFDSERTIANTETSGVHVCDEQEFTTRLGTSRYAIRVGEHPEEKDSLGHDISDAITAQLIGAPMPLKFKDPNIDEFTDSADQMPMGLADYILGGRK